MDRLQLAHADVLRHPPGAPATAHCRRDRRGAWHLAQPSDESGDGALGQGLVVDDARARRWSSAAAAAVADRGG